MKKYFVDFWNNIQEGPPDLIEGLKKFYKNIKGFYGSASSKNSSGSIPPRTEDTLDFSRWVWWMVSIILIVYILSGIYIVQPAEQAVVLRLGKYNRTIGKGPHWYPRLLEQVIVLNTEQISASRISGTMLTSDENLVTVEIQVQYRVNNVENYLFKIAEPNKSLEQAAESALRQVVGKNGLDFIITSGRYIIAKEVEDLLRILMKHYNSGIHVLSVSYKEGKAPDQVKEAFNDATRAREDRERFIHQAEAYSNKVRAEVLGKAQTMLKDAEAYKSEVVNRALGDVARFNALLPEYKKSPRVIKNRLYIDAIEHILTNTSKIMMDTQANSMFYLPIEQLLKLNKSSKQEIVVDNNGVMKDGN